MAEPLDATNASAEDLIDAFFDHLRLRHLDDERGQHLSRVADQKDVACVLEEAEVEINKMMRHVLDEQTPRGVFGLQLEQALHHGVAVALT